MAWKPLGWTPIWFSEVEEFPCQVLAHHHPTVPNLGNSIAVPCLIWIGQQVQRVEDARRPAVWGVPEAHSPDPEA